ncbi:MAG: hypothetical protein D6828_03110, partial [Nitrospirae bacterium]
TGLISPYKERAIARHEIMISLESLIKIAAYLLKNKGSFYMLYHPFRLVELISLMKKYQLEPKRMRFIHSRIGEDAKMVLLEAVKGAGQWLNVEYPLFIYDKKGDYTEEINKLL